jgi:Alpha 1,4-glycosyltransferase conserved region/Glycosyltransferase sugar-binding region containing DXD motif
MVCTLESVKNVNPDLRLIVIFTKPATHLDLKENPALAQILSKTSNIHLATLDVSLILKNSVFNNITGRFNRSIAPLQHVSDALRIYIVWKVGGIYMDLDIVFVKNLTHLFDKNFTYSATTHIINNCLFGFSKGHPLLKMMENMVENYVPENYAAGPATFERTLTKLHKKNSTEMIALGKVDDVHILRHTGIGPVVYSNVDFYFEETPKEIHRSMLVRGNAFHMWNKLTWNRTVPLNSNCTYARIAREFCPKSFWSCDKVF